MHRKRWSIIPGLICVCVLVVGHLLEYAWGGESRGIALHHQASGLHVSLTTQPSPPRAGDNLLRIELVDAQKQPIPHAQVRLVLTQASTMPGMHSERPREIATAPTHAGGYEGRVHLASPGRWEVIVHVVPPSRPATEAIFYLNVEPF
jgi:hypothetical protein